MKALLALFTSGLLLAGCGGGSSSDVGSPVAGSSQSTGSSPSTGGAASVPASTNTGNGTASEIAAVRYIVTVISPDGAAKGLNPSGQVLYTRTINGSERTFFYNGTTSIEVPGTGEKLNSKGQVAGVIRDDPHSSGGRGYLWSESTGIVDLRGPQEIVYSVTGLNDAGQVIGTMPGPFKFESQQEIRAFSWSQAGGLANLGTFGGMFSFALAVNNSGQVVGNSSDSPDDIHGILYPFIWTPSGGMVRIPGASQNSNWWVKPTHINNNGQVAGHMFLDSLSRTARAMFGTAGEGMIDLGTLSGEQATDWGPNSEVTAMNEAGQVVGISDIPSGELGGPPSGFSYENGERFDSGNRGFFWDKAIGMVDLRTLGGIQSFPSDINPAGQVVGSSETDVNGNSVAFIWSRKTGMVDLNSLLQNAPAGLVLTAAHKITDSGMIVANSNKGVVLLKPANVK